MDQTDHLLALIYEAALDPARWPAALAMLADATGGVGAHVVVLDKVAGATGGLRPRLKVSGTRRMDPNAADGYMKRWHALDPLLAAAGHATGPPGTILLCHEFLPEDFVAHDPYFQEFLIPSGGRFQAGVTLLNDENCVAMLDVHARDVPFERGQLALWAPVIAHLRRAIRLAIVLTRHSEREARLRAALDRQNSVCVMVDDGGRVVDQSLAGAEMLARGDGLRLDLGGRVGFADETATRRLHALITEACRGRGGGEVPFELQRRRAGAIQIIPAGVTCDNPFSSLNAGCALLFVEASPPRGAPACLIRRAVGCSPAEAEVAAALVAGQAPREIAVERATSIHTVRAQIRNLLEATGTHRITELVNVITRM